MRNCLIAITIFISTLGSKGQTSKDFLWLKNDSSYYFIDNSKHCWYTFKLKTDTIFHVEKFMFFARNKDFQVNNIFVDGGHDFKGAHNDYDAEKYMLENKMNWEYKYQKKLMKKSLQKGYEWYYDSSSKPFLIWWIKTPGNAKSPNRTISKEVNKTYEFGISDKVDSVELNVSYSLYIDFIIHNNNSTSISFSVMENENLSNEINIAKDIINSLNVYAGPIDLSLFAKRLKNPDDYAFTDSLNLIHIQFPHAINVLDRYFKQSLMVSFPEKMNIYNAASVLWQYRNDSTTFDEFIDKRRNINQNRGKVTTLVDEQDIKRDFYIGTNPNYHCQDVYMQTDRIFCFLNFTATDKTYEFNLPLFNELVKSITLK